MEEASLVDNILDRFVLDALKDAYNRGWRNGWSARQEYDRGGYLVREIASRSQCTQGVLGR